MVLLGEAAFCDLWKHPRLPLAREAHSLLERCGVAASCPPSLGLQVCLPASAAVGWSARA